MPVADDVRGQVADEVFQHVRPVARGEVQSCDGLQASHERSSLLGNGHGRAGPAASSLLTHCLTMEKSGMVKGRTCFLS